MTEKYFIYSVLIFFGAILFLPLGVLWFLQRLKFLQKLVRLNTLKRQQKSEIPVLFSSEILKQACRILFHKHGLESRAALLFLVIGKPQKAATLLNILYPQISLLLLAHIDARAAYKKILKNKKLFTNSATSAATATAIIAGIKLKPFIILNY